MLNQEIINYIQERRLKPSVIAEALHINPIRFKAIMSGTDSMNLSELETFCKIVGFTPSQYMRKRKNGDV